VAAAEAQLTQEQAEWEAADRRRAAEEAQAATASAQFEKEAAEAADAKQSFEKEAAEAAEAEARRVQAVRRQLSGQGPLCARLALWPSRGSCLRGCGACPRT
jgi:hypothetical protein